MTQVDAQNLIDGTWVGTPAVERMNPADPAELVAVSPQSGRKDAEDAIAAAQRAQPAWATTPAPARGAILDAASRLLEQRSDAVARDLVREEGKTLAEATGEVQRAVGVLRFFAGEGHRIGGQTLPASTPDTLIYTRREPIGVAAVITPWNFPIAIPAWKMAPALISGNAVVLKPAELTPLSANHLASALMDAGLPAGVLNVIHGQGSEVGAALVADERVGAVSFTGSTATGLIVQRVASARMARVQLEMGGKNAIIVTDDADVERAAKIVARSAFGLTGQACTATSRVITTAGIADRFADALVAEASTFTPGDGLAAGTAMGPIVSHDQHAKVVGYADGALADGAERITPNGGADGLLLAPAVLRGVAPDDRLAQEEVFGPVLAMIEVDDFATALDVTDSVRYGLTAGICTNDLAKAHAFADRTQVGVVKINQPTVGLELQVPFGGVKASSTGTFREQGTVATEFFTWSKSVYLSY